MRMSRGCVCLLGAALFLLGGSSRAQDVPRIGNSSPEGVASEVPADRFGFGQYDEHTRWLVNSEVGTYAGLGNKLPHSSFGTSIEVPISRRLELQGGLAFSPDRKVITNDGRTIVASAEAIFWANHYFGIAGGAAYSRLWTSQFDKAAWLPAPGVVCRFRFLGSPTRMHLDYVVPTGSIDKHGIESSRLQGPEFYVESRIANVGPMTMRFGLKWDLYHFLEQGNPQCDGTFGGPVTCRRKGATTGAAALTLRFEWLKNASNIPF